MNLEEYMNILHTAEHLKNNTRHSWTSTGRHESVAEHSWRLTIMAFFMKDEFPEVDLDKVIRMCIFHDMGEAFTGDIPAFEKTNAHEDVENQAITAWLSTLPKNYKEELTLLFEEMNELRTPEAQLYKALDKMEAVIQHNEAPIDTWLPLEYELQFTYGEKETNSLPPMKRLKEYVNEITRQKINEEGKKDK